MSDSLFRTLPGKMSIAATGGMGAAVCCHPLDVVRVMMQVSDKKQGTVSTAVEVFQTSGLKRGLYSGLSAGFLRQWTYGACRIGIYSFLLNRQAEPSKVGFGMKLAFGMISGGIGSVVGTPAELALVRMSADAKLPLAERRGQGVHKVLGGIIHDEGFLAMWRGVTPTVARAMSLSSVVLAVTSESKQRLPGVHGVFEANPTFTFAASTLIASFAGTIASQPFDVVKSKMQNMVVPENGPPPYTSAMDCAAKCVREGPLTLMRGFSPAFIKLTPYTMISLTLVEKITQLLTGKSAL